MFNHLVLPELPQLEQITQDNGKRHYRTNAGLYLPSVTTVLSGADPNKEESLRGWRNYVGEQRASEILENSRARGTKLDKMVEDHLYNLTVTIEQDDAGDMFMALLPYLQHISNIHFLQPALHSERLGVAGSADIIAEYDGVLNIIDIKNARKTRTPEMIWTYFLQITAYALMYNELTSYRIKNGIVLMAVENAPTQIFHIKIVDYVEPLLRVIKQYQHSHPS